MGKYVRDFLSSDNARTIMTYDLEKLSNKLYKVSVGNVDEDTAERIKIKYDIDDSTIMTFNVLGMTGILLLRNLASSIIEYIKDEINHRIAELLKGKYPLKFNLDNPIDVILNKFCEVYDKKPVALMIPNWQLLHTSDDSYEILNTVDVITDETISFPRIGCENDYSVNIDIADVADDYIEFKFNIK